MAGIQIDGVNNKIDFDDDADTSISSATDDTLVIESGGVNVASITAGEFAINEGSTDLDFRVESNDNTHMLFVDGGNNVIGIGTSSIDTNAQVHIEGPQEYLVMKHAGQMGIKLYGDDTNVIYSYDKTADSLTGGIAWSHADGTTLFYTNGSNERMRIQSDGTLLVGKTSSGITNVGVEAASDKLSATVASANVCYFNRETNDGSVVIIYGDGNDEGGIGVSGNTVQFNGFTGSHWSRLADNSKPTILRGTIMESIDEMCDWYQAVADVAEVNYTAEDQEVIDGDKNVGDVKTEAYKVKESIALGDKSIGDAITFTSNGTEYTGTIVKEDDVKHNKCKVSDTADSKKIYGLFSNWDDADDGLDGDVNDMNIVQVGTYIIRVNKDVTVEAGDLLVSNGDGTAKVQDDDIIRSKTVAKVNSNIKVETYSDGSYTVPCTLHC
jgi:predicted DNA-binding protein